MSLHSLYVFHYLYFNYFPWLFYKIHRRDIFLSITFTTCHLPSTCQCPSGFVLGPFLFAFLPTKLYSSPRPLLGASFLGHFITNPTYQWPENRVAYSNINKFLCLCLNLSLYSWFHTISCPELGLINCQNSFDLWRSTELYCVVKHVGSKPDWVQIQPLWLRIE